jgi:hypothetical protein
VVLLRHAEKPHDDVLGIDEQGREDARSLSVRGWQRAGALLRWLLPAEGPPPFGEPAGLWAAGPTATHPSRRPPLTLAPLARHLGLPVDTSLDVEDLEAVAVALLATEGTALASWRHDDLPALAQALARLVGCDAAAVPAQWPSEVFDAAWVFERGPEGRWGFRAVAQRLLDCDRERIDV